MRRHRLSQGSEADRRSLGDQQNTFYFASSSLIVKRIRELGLWPILDGSREHLPRDEKARGKRNVCSFIVLQV